MDSRPNSGSFHILLVDDDLRIRQLLQKFLIRNGYWCTEARDAAHASHLLELFKFDMIILDIMMPGEDGVSFAKRLRERTEVPIIFLSAKGNVEDRVDGLKAGADDYVSKPFEPDELLLRMQAVLRRMQFVGDEMPTEVMLGKYLFDMERGELWLDDRQVRLSPSEVFMMRRLAKTPSQPIDRTELFDGASEHDFQALDRAVHLRVARLRKKLEEDPRNPLYLKTVRGKGYMLVPD